MYTVSDLYDSERNPRINEISLKLLLDYYEAYLLPYTYKIILEDENIITLCFPAEALCHLLGIETIVKRAVNRNDIHNYKGVDGFNNIKNLLVTFDTLKHLNGKMFNSVKDKFVFFYLLPKLFVNKNAVFYDGSTAGSNICSDIIFYDNFVKAYVHMGVVKNTDEIYVPRTFFVERVTVGNDGIRFIKDQQKLNIAKIEAVQALDKIALPSIH